MLTLALSSVRRRPGRFVSTLLAAFLGAAIVMAFSSLHDTAGADGVDDVSAETLGITAGVVGGYGSLLVFFAVASTLTVTVRQRAGELELLRSAGATPAQLTRMVVGEAAVVGLVGAAAAVGPAALGGRLLVERFRDSGQVAGDVGHVFGPIGLMSGMGVTLLASVGAAFLAVRRGRGRSAGARAPRGRVRTVAGVVALVAGAAGVCTTFALDATEPALMAPAAYGSILLALGLASFSPVLLRALPARLQPLPGALGGAAGELAAHNLRQRAAQASGVLMPLILFTGMATATLYMQAAESDARAASGLVKSVDDKNLETVNLVVVGVIVAFCCVMLVNSLYAATSYRGREFAQQRLCGATPGQVLRTVGAEGLVLLVTGVFLGTAAGLAGLVPYCLVRADRALPQAGPGIWLGVVAVAAVATLVTGLGTAGRMLRTPAVRAVGAGA